MAKTILVIDDSPTVRQQVTLCLAQGGYRVIEAVDGSDALNKLLPGIAMAICDLNMPNMNGIEFLTAARSRGSAVPVVMLTTECKPEFVTQAKQAGARGWMVKPFKPEQLLQVVQKLAA